MRGTSEEDEDDEYVSEESEGDDEVPDEPDEEEEEEPYEEEIVPQVVVSQEMPRSLPLSMGCLKFHRPQRAAASICPPGRLLHLQSGAQWLMCRRLHDS